MLSLAALLSIDWLTVGIGTFAAVPRCRPRRFPAREQDLQAEAPSFPQAASFSRFASWISSRRARGANSGSCSRRTLHALMRSKRDNGSAGCQRQISDRNGHSWAKAQMGASLGFKIFPTQWVAARAFKRPNAGGALRALSVIGYFIFPGQLVERRLVAPCPIAVFGHVELLVLIIFDASARLIALAVSFSVHATWFHSRRISNRAIGRHRDQTPRRHHAARHPACEMPPSRHRLTAIVAALYLTIWLSIAATPRLIAPLPPWPIRRGGRCSRGLPSSRTFRSVRWRRRLASHCRRS